MGGEVSRGDDGAEEGEIEMAVSDEQLAALLQHCGDFAREMIEKNGEFYPFGAEIGVTGELKSLGFWTGEERPAASKLYSYAESVMKAKASSGEILGGAIAVNVNIPPQFESKFEDGIRVLVESENLCRLIYQPYLIGKGGFFGRKRTVEYGEMFGVEIDPILFGQ